jgi:hypothetical protein
MGIEKHRKITAAALGALAVAGALAVGGARASGAFNDPAGDARGAPDITAVSVTDSPSSGTITVAVTASGLVANTDLIVWLDTDKNSSTGSRSGAEYTLDVWQDAGDWGWTIDRWTGSDWKMVPETPSLLFSRSGDVFTWTLNKSDLGGANGFAFYVGGYLLDAGGNVSQSDFAPDGGSWAYDLSAKPTADVRAVVGKPLAVPAKALAGKLLTLSFPVSRSDNGEPLSGASIASTATIAGKAVPHTRSLSGPQATVSVLVPKKAKGKQLTVTVRISVGGQTTTKTVSFRVG